MEISLGKGFGQVHFGLRHEEVLSILGKPDKEYFTDEGNKRIQFNNLLLELSFEPENGNLLGWIEVQFPEAKLFGHKLIGLEKSEVIEIVESILKEGGELEDFGSFDSVFYETRWLELQFEFGRCRSINFGVCYDENDEPIWPNLSASFQSSEKDKRNET